MSQQQNPADAQKAMLGLLHRLVAAAGGMARIDLASIPDNIELNVRVERGTAYVTARQLPAVVAAPADALAGLAKRARVNGH